MSLRRFVVLLVVAVFGALVAALSQSGSASPVAAAAEHGASSAGAAEVVDARTRFSSTFRDPAGQMTTRVSAAPVHFRDGGEWKTIDDSLAERPDGSLMTEATGYDLLLPQDLTAPVSVVKGDAGVSFRLRGAAAGDRSIDDSTATFEDARPGVDVTYTAGPDMVKENLVLADASAERAFAFDLDPAGGATPRLAKDGGVDLVQPDGSVGARIAAPVMTDARGEISTDLAYALRRGDDGWVLGLDADTAWLRSERRAWPIQVDPTSYFGVQTDALIKDPKGGPDTPFGQSSYLQVSSEGDARRRSLVRFTDLSATIPKSAVVTDASANFYNDGGGDSGLDVQAMQLTRPFAQAGANWGTSNGTTAWTMPGGDFDAQPLDTQTIDATQPGWNRLWVGNAVQDWVNKPAENYGMLLKLANESTGAGNTRTSTWRSVWGGGNFPYLEVEWEDATGAKPNWTFDTIDLSDRSSLSVNVATGNVAYTSSDAHVAGVGGMDLSIDRTYNSRSSWSGAGQGWHLGHGMENWLATYNNGQTRVIRTPDHAAWRFEKTGTNWTSPAALNATLTDVSGGAKLVFNRSGETWFYGATTSPNVTWREDKNGHRISYAYNGSGELTKITDTRGRDYTVGRNGSGLPTSINDANYPGGRSWAYGYATTGSITNLASYTDANLKTANYGYDPGTSDLTQITDARGNKIKLTYSYAYDPSGVLPRVTSIQRMTNADFANPVGPKVTYSYDLANSKTTVTGARGNAAGATASQFQTVYSYDKDLQVTGVKNPLGQDSASVFSQNGDTTKFTSQSGGASGTTAAISDATFSPGENNLTDTASPLNGGKRETTHSEFYGSSDTFGNAAASPATGQYRTKNTTDAQGNMTAFEYDAAGNLTRSAQSAMQTPSQVQATLTYTNGTEANTPPKGLLKTATDGKGNVTGYGYDNKGHLLTVKPPLVSGVNPGEFAYTYEAGTSRRSKQTDASGATQTYAYDKLDRLTSITNGNGQKVTYGYDNNGNLTSRSWTSGGTNATYTYDALNRMTSETVGGATTNYSYDDAGNLATMTDGGGTTTYGYDRLDRVNSIAPPAGGTVTAIYDDTGSPRTRTWTYPGGQKQTTSYSLSGKVLGVAATSSSNTAIAGLTYGYAAGARETVLRQTEAQTTVSPKTTTYAYDQANRLCWATTKSVTSPTCGTVPAGAGGTTWSYGWDAASNRIATKVDANGTVTRNDTYTHDAANRIDGLTHDSRGNLTAGSLAYDAWNRHTTAGSISLAYGSPDNTELLSDGATSLRNSQLGLTTSSTSGTPTYYVRTPDGELVGERTSAGTRYAILDALGSTRWLLSGNTISRGYDYTPDGESTVSTGTGADTRIRFAGGDLTTTGRYHFGARYYQPGLARWTQRDPLDQASDLADANAYAYAGANPASFVDPAGEGWVRKCTAVAGCVWVFGGSMDGRTEGSVPDPPPREAAKPGPPRDRKPEAGKEPPPDDDGLCSIILCIVS